MINKFSYPSFKGAFLIDYNKTPSNMKEEFDKAVGANGKIIYNNFPDKNKTFYILKDSKDYNIAQFIQRNNLKFRYFPEMNTRLCFEPSEPEKVTNYIRVNKPHTIRKISDLIAFVQENRFKNRAIQNSHLGFHKQVLKNLKINIAGKGQKDARGVYTIQDKANDGLVCFSPKNKNNIIYLYTKPSNDYDPVVRYAIDTNGNPLRTYQTPDEIRIFREKFHEAIKHHLHISE